MIDKLSFLKTKTNKYPLAFTLNVMEAIQDKYGSLNKWSELISKSEEPNISAIKFFIFEAIKEGIEIENQKIEITLKDVGRIITEVGIVKVSEIIKDLIENSTKNDDYDENGSEQNIKNEQTMKSQK